MACIPLVNFCGYSLRKGVKLIAMMEMALSGCFILACIIATPIIINFGKMTSQKEDKDLIREHYPHSWWTSELFQGDHSGRLQDFEYTKGWATLLLIAELYARLFFSIGIFILGILLWDASIKGNKTNTDHWVNIHYGIVALSLYLFIDHVLIPRQTPSSSSSVGQVLHLWFIVLQLYSVFVVHSFSKELGRREDLRQINLQIISQT
ncbi:uncharacterized protein LOC110852572 [Folsomia candida]|uniref:Uncharacterized protein n=1 Tax=Folsomia candida TaxID=158441 RepID=A0A226E2K0_FOLCA|nr:uncharacterized protein LOC110852572 [Folsomia candida]OXA51962.1 hypothetical protein Fcan01_13799 [Folsomia candida]